jgi:hypothetical protein
MPEVHACKFDFKNHGKAQLTSQLVKADGKDAKLERI